MPTAGCSSGSMWRRQTNEVMSDVSPPPGTVVISLDAELAWGFHDLRDPPADRIAGARTSWLRLLDLFDEFHVPATWTVVGHLFHDSCDGRHEDRLAPPGWFDRDPGGGGPSEWHGRDLIEAIVSADVEHEIGCHTFSHVLFDDPDITSEIVGDELQAWTELAGELGINPSSFTFPRNVVGFRETLAAHGFTSYRGPEPPRWFDGRRFRRPLKFLDFLIGYSDPPISDPVVDEYGMVNIPASLEVYSFEGPLPRIISRIDGDPILHQVARGLSASSAQGTVFHLWFHPNDLTTETDFTRMREILAMIAAYRDRGEVRVERMADVAARVRETAVTKSPNAVR